MAEPTYTPPPVTGYRTLTQADVDLMNDIKKAEAAYLAVVRYAADRVEDAYEAALNSGDEAEMLRIADANPRRWISIGRTHVEQATMAVCRAIAQPARN